MNWQSIERNWPAFFGRIEERWPRVDEADLIQIDGDRKGFVEYLSKVHDLTSSEANEEIDAWLAGELPADVYMDEHHDEASIRASGRTIHPGEDVYDDDRLFGDDDAKEPPVGRDA